MRKTHWRRGARRQWPVFQPVQKMADFYTAAIQRCRDSRQTQAGGLSFGSPEWGEKGRPPGSGASDLRVEVEEGVERALELRFDLFARALDEVHGDVSLVAGGQFEI